MQKEKILVVDDDKNICELLRIYLEKEGYAVVMAHNGIDAVNAFNAGNPDLILLDIITPGLPCPIRVVPARRPRRSHGRSSTPP